MMSAATVTYHELPPLSAWAGDINTMQSHEALLNHTITTSESPHQHQHFIDPAHFIDSSAAWNTFPYGPLLTGADSVLNDSGNQFDPVASSSSPHHWNQASIPGSPVVPTSYPQNACGVGVTSAAGGDFRWNRGSKKPCGSKMRSATAGSDGQSDSSANGDMLSASSSSSGPEELCLVCGDKASGYHYNALTCEGCKGFFRRSITRKARYYCKYGGHCDIDMYMRRKCQDCRLRKCMLIGMRPELVIPEDQCRIKREAKMKMRALNGGTLPSSPKTLTPASTPVEERSKDGVSPPQQVHSTEPTLETCAPQSGLSDEQKELINRLTLSQAQFDLPSNEAIAQLSTFTGGGKQAEAVASFQHLAELTILTVQLILDFTRHLPGFSTLCKEDQHTLLAASTEILMLRTARRYEAKNDTLVLGNKSTSWVYNRDAYKRAGIGHATDAIFDFAQSIKRLKVDDAEYALLTAIAVFSDRPGLQEPKKVEDIQEVYTSALQAYVESQRHHSRGVFARLLMKLTDLRSLSSEHKEMLTPWRQAEAAREGSMMGRQMQHQPSTTTLPETSGVHEPTNEAESVTGGYRMPNVRIKVEPLHGTAGGLSSQAVVSSTPLPDSNFALHNYSHYTNVYNS